MIVDVPLSLLILLGGVVLLAGMVNGVAGFGFALVGTMTLATAIDPATAVVFVILPILSVNPSLVRDLSGTELRTSGRRFCPLVGAALVGTVVGMVVLDRLPEAPLRIGLGPVTLGFVASSQGLVPIPGRTATEDRCFVETTPAMLGVGAVSGVLFGGTNVGVQLIAYLRSCDLSHGLFVGVVAMVFLGLDTVRVGAAGVLGLYPDTAVVVGSVLAAMPAVIGAAMGKRLRDRVGERWRRRAVLGLLTIVGVRLVTSGLRDAPRNRSSPRWSDRRRRPSATGCRRLPGPRRAGPDVSACVGSRPVRGECGRGASQPGSTRTRRWRSSADAE
ncbi:MAG: sulfite exporter TauE/SafE family protein [Haloarculaceae archaeon]